MDKDFGDWYEDFLTATSAIGIVVMCILMYLGYQQVNIGLKVGQVKTWST